MFKAFLNEEGKKIWGYVFPEGLVPIKSPVPQRAKLGAEFELVFLVHWSALTQEQRELILEDLQRKFVAARAEVESQILEKGMPLRASLVDATSIPARYF